MEKTSSENVKQNFFPHISVTFTFLFQAPVLIINMSTNIHELNFNTENYTTNNPIWIHIEFRVAWCPDWSSNIQTKRISQLADINYLRSKIIDTFKKRGPQSEHLGGLCGNGLGEGSHKKDPSGDNTYISSGTILSFWTPTDITKHPNYLFIYIWQVQNTQIIELIWSILKH